MNSKMIELKIIYPIHLLVFSFFRIFSRKAIILFERPNPQHGSQLMATKKAALDRAAKNASSRFLEALSIVSKFTDTLSLVDRTEISNRMEVMFPGRIRSLEIYSKVMWFTCEVSTYIIFIFTDHIIMGNAYC